MTGQGHCGWCGRRCGDTSLYYCSEPCQRAWHAARTERGTHQAPCVVCHEDAGPAYLCVACWGQLAARLRGVAELTAELDVALARQARTTPRLGGRPAEQPLPYHLGAADAAEVLRTTLAAWVRLLWEEHGQHTAGGIQPPLLGGTQPAALAGWLLQDQVATWIRRHPAADELVDEISHAIAQAWRVVDRAPGRAYLGQCSADTTTGPCPQDLYAPDDRETVCCPSCGATWSVTERRAVLLTALADQYVPLRTLAGLLPGLGQPVSVAALRRLAHRGLLVAWSWIEDPPGSGHWVVRPRQPSDAGPVLLQVGQVLDYLQARQRAA